MYLGLTTIYTCMKKHILGILYLAKIKPETCFAFEKQHQHMAQYKIDISLSRKVQLQRFSKQRLTIML